MIETKWRSRIFEKKSWGRDFGPNVVEKRLFLHFLQKSSLDFDILWSERGSYGTWSVCQVWSPGKIWFSRYGAFCDPEKAPKRLFRLFLENVSLDFANFLSEQGSYGTRRVCKVWRPEHIWFSRYGAKRGSNGGQNGVCSDFLEKFSLVFLDIVHVNRGQ